jgi:hypothetical protein
VGFTLSAAAALSTTAMERDRAWVLAFAGMTARKTCPPGESRGLLQPVALRPNKNVTPAKAGAHRGQRHLPAPASRLPIPSNLSEPSR